MNTPYASTDTRARILYVATIDTTIRRFLIPHLMALQARNIAVEIACHVGYSAEHIPRSDFTVHNIPFSRRWFSTGNIIALAKLTRLIRRRQYDLVHVHTPIAAVLGRLATRLSGCRGTKVLYTVHGFHFSRMGNPIKNGVFMVIERIAGRWTDALIVMNEEDLSAARSLQIVPRDRIFLVKGVGVDTELFSPKAEVLEEIKRRKSNSAKVVGMIAEFTARKGQRDLIEAAGYLIEGGRDVLFVLVGKGPLLDSVMNHSIVKKNAGHFLFLGQRSDIPEILNSMDVLVLPSSREGLPRIIQEAMACGKPVIASDVKGNRDLVGHGQTGLLVPYGSPQAIAEAILFMLENEGVAREMGERGRVFVRKELQEASIVEMTLAIQEDLLNESLR